MSAQTAGLIFTNNQGLGGGTSTYVTDTLPDYTFTPSNNTGFSSTISNNPWNGSYSNTDAPQYGSKYLPIKDLVLIADRSRWINGKTTYQVIFYEPFPQVQAYVFGNVQLNYLGSQATVLFKTIGDGMSVNGVIRQVAFVVQPSASATATAQVVVDGANEGTVSFGNYTSAAPATPSTAVWSAQLHNTAQENYNIHDIRLTALQASTLAIGGVVVYFQSPNGLIDQFPGTSYVNKTKVATASGVSLALPSFGSSLGGNALIYKTTTAGYTISAISATTIASAASGSSGTNILNMSVGTGASLLAGYGMVLSQGTSTYIGSISSISTDALTMGNTLGFGTSTIASIYTAWQGGVSLSINASLMTRAYTIDFSRMSSVNGFSSTIFDPQGQYALWGNNIGFSQIDGNQCAVFLGASGFMQLDGYYSAAEIETIGNGIFSATLSINGFASWSQNAGQTGSVKKTVFTNAGPGWNSFNLGCGASMTAGISITPGMGIQRINLYQVSRNLGISYGALADMDFCQTYTNRDAVNASLMALGGNRRVYADQLFFQNTWTRGVTWSVPGGVYYQGASTNGSLTFQYYGQQFGIVGTLNTGSTLALDGVGMSLSPAGMQSVATLGFHTVTYSGGTAIISAIDYINPIYRLRVDANISPPLTTALPIGIAPTVQIFYGGTGIYSPPQTRIPLYLEVTMVGGGAGGSASTGGTVGGTGMPTTFGGLIAGGAPAPSGLGNGGVGGLPTTILGPIILAATQGAYGGMSATGVSGGNGGTSPLGGGGGSTGDAAGTAGAANSGSGGGGANNGGAGGGAGGYIQAIITNLSQAFSWAVGPGGAGGTNGGGNAGGAGAAGIIIVKEFYQ